MPKLKCCGCKKRFPKEPMIEAPNKSKFHSKDCQVDYAVRKGREATAKRIAKTKADTKKKNAKFDKEFYDNDRKTRNAAAVKWCHKYIKMRDTGQPCICCGNPLEPGFHAGHFKRADKNPMLKYHEDNINGQNRQCNFYEGGDKGNYENNLRVKIGNERVDWIIANQGGVMKRTPQEYKEIENYYKAKIKELETCNSG